MAKSNSLDKIKNLTRDLSDISEISSSSIVLSLSDESFAKPIEIVGKRFCFSGPCISDYRDHIIGKLTKMGATVSTTLDKRVDYLVVDDISLSSNKMKKATFLKIRKITSLDILSNNEYKNFKRDLSTSESNALFDTEIGNV